MMGNMMIQPQMYFQLNNIPFFAGSYMIMNVSHQIRANNMSTTFKGVRQNNSPVTIVTEPTSFLSFQFDGTIYSASPFTTLSAKTEDVAKEKQMNNTTELLPDNIVQNYSPTTGSAILRSLINTGPEIHQGYDIEVTSNTLIQSVNKKGTILYNLAGDANVKGRLIIEHTPDVNGDGYYYYTGYFGLRGNGVFPTGQSIAPNTSLGQGSIFNVKNYPETYYYHFEIKRSKERITTYQEYSTSPNLQAIQIPTTEKLPFKLYAIALHGNEIF